MAPRLHMQRLLKTAQGAQSPGVGMVRSREVAFRLHAGLLTPSPEFGQVLDQVYRAWVSRSGRPSRSDDS